MSGSLSQLVPPVPRLEVPSASQQACYTLCQFHKDPGHTFYLTLSLASLILPATWPSSPLLIGFRKWYTLWPCQNSPKSRRQQMYSFNRSLDSKASCVTFFQILGCVLSPTGGLSQLLLWHPSRVQWPDGEVESRTGDWTLPPLQPRSQNFVWIEYVHNFLPSTVTGLTPFQIIYGYQPPLLTNQEKEALVPSAQALLRWIHRCFLQKTIQSNYLWTCLFVNLLACLPACLLICLPV